MLEKNSAAGMMHGMELVIDRKAGWARLVLNRPAQKNALNTVLLGALAEALDVLARDLSVRAVVLTGADGNFAAGADIGEIEGKSSAEGAADPRKAHWAAVRAFPKPLIAAVDGFALGGGFELALMADIMVLGPTARLGLPETNLGLIPGAGGGQRLMALAGRARAMRMVLTGELIDARTAVDWGIAAWLSEGSAAVIAESLAAKLADRAPLAMMAAKRALIAGEERALALSEERLAFEALLDTADKAEGIRAFRDRRKPEFKGE
jgi:enoyl-CoA hydratase